MTDIPGFYWWQCGKHDDHRTKFTGTELTDLIHKLAKSGWDQSILESACGECKGIRRIAYEFPRKEDHKVLQVIHVVGMSEHEPSYVPMLWETLATGEKETWFDFKYITGNRWNGLKSPAVMEKSALAEILKNYPKVTGKSPIQ